MLFINQNVFMTTVSKNYYYNSFIIEKYRKKLNHVECKIIERIKKTKRKDIRLLTMIQLLNLKFVISIEFSKRRRGYIVGRT